VTCLLGMSIPAGPVSKHNPVLSVKRVRCLYFLGRFMVHQETVVKETE